MSPIANPSPLPQIIQDFFILVHTFFIDVSADQEQLEKIAEKLEALGYLSNLKNENKVILISLKLQMNSVL